MEVDPEQTEADAMRDAEREHLRQTGPASDMREILKGVFIHILRDANEAARIDASFDIEKLSEWARICVPLDTELQAANEKPEQARQRIAARNQRLDRESYRLFGADTPSFCYCDRTGFERRVGKWRTEKGRIVEGPYVRRCRAWPRKANPFWNEDPAHYDRDEGEAVCPAAVEFQRKRFEKKQQREAGERSGRSPRRYD